MDKTVLLTERCIVREFTIEDLATLFELYGQPGMTRFVEPLYQWEEERQYQERYIELIYRKYGYGLWMVEDRKTGQVIGRIGVESHGGDPEGVAELGYLVSQDRQGQGIATEVCRAVLDYARETLHLNRLYARIHPENEASNRLAAGLGLVPTNRFDRNDRIWERSLE